MLLAAHMLVKYRRAEGPAGRFHTESRDALVVARRIPSGASVCGSFCEYKLSNGETIAFPYRVYRVENAEIPLEFTPVQKLIFHAFLSRSDNGYVRETHIHEILDMDCPEWIFPYIVKLSDEYVVEILDLIYSYLKDRDCQEIQNFCKLNLPSFVRSYDRMASYWGEYSGGSFYQYVGRKLFRSCYGYQRSLWRELEPHQPMRNRRTLRRPPPHHLPFQGTS